MYDQDYNNYFPQKLRAIQFNSALAITGALRGTSREKICHELCLESLNNRRLCRKVRWLYKIFNNQSPKCLFEISPTLNRSYTTRNVINIPLFKEKHNFFKRAFSIYFNRVA